MSQGVITNELVSVGRFDLLLCGRCGWCVGWEYVTHSYKDDGLGSVERDSQEHYHG